MLDDLKEFMEITQETRDDYEKAFQARLPYLNETANSDCPLKSKNIFEYEEDKIEIAVKRRLLEKMRQLSSNYFPPDMLKEAKKTEKSMENYLEDLEKRWIFYGNPQGSNIGTEIKPRVPKRLIIDENYPITIEFLKNALEKL